MASSLDRSLDEILADRQETKKNPRNGDRNRNNNNNSNSGRGDGYRRRERQDYPRDGVRKSFRDDAPRNLDTEWVHDRYEDNGGRRSAPRRRYSPDAADSGAGTRIRVDNIHYDLTQEDIEGLFAKIGPVAKLSLQYDRAGRSEGTAYVTYESSRDAQEAVREYDGANANGQPIRLTMMPNGPNRRNPFDHAVMPGRPLSERITVPGNRSRSFSPRRNRQMDDDEAARRGVDRYRPGGQSRSPMPRSGRRDGGRDGGRRPGARRDGGGGGGPNKSEADKGRGGRDGRPKKTQEELDAEMADYFGGGEASANANGGNTAAPVAAAVVAEDDIDMIE